MKSNLQHWKEIAVKQGKKIAQLESQLEERDYRYCPYCSNKLSHKVDTDANTKLVCKYALCPRKLKTQ